MYLIFTGSLAKVPLPALTGPLTCHLPITFSGIECCFDVQPLKRAFHAYIFLDECSNRIELGIENYKINSSYFDFTFGKCLVVYILQCYILFLDQ